MPYTYQQRRRPQGLQDTAPERTSAPGPSLDALMTGAATPTAAQKGRSIDLDAAMKAKMEHAFGDLSNLKLYESRAVADAGAEAVAQGNEIAFAPAMANFSTRSGQERLGHELSHVMSQRSGAVRGTGFLANAALEARADREGAMAAAGEQVYTGPVTHALSDAAPSPAVAGPMQAKRFWEADEPTEEENRDALLQLKNERIKRGNFISTQTAGEYLVKESEEEKNARMEKAESDATEVYLERLRAQQEAEQRQQQSNQNEEDEFNNSADMIEVDEEGKPLGGAPAGGTTPGEDKIEVPEELMRSYRQRAMIDHFTASSRNLILGNWHLFEAMYDDPDPENADQSENAVFERTLMHSKAFKRFTKERKKYENMPYEKLERKYKNENNKKWWQFWK